MSVSDNRQRVSDTGENLEEFTARLDGCCDHHSVLHRCEQLPPTIDSHVATLGTQNVVLTHHTFGTCSGTLAERLDRARLMTEPLNGREMQWLSTPTPPSQRAA